MKFICEKCGEKLKPVMIRTCNQAPPVHLQQIGKNNQYLYQCDSCMITVTRVLEQEKQNGNN